MFHIVCKLDNKLQNWQILSMGIFDLKRVLFLQFHCIWIMYLPSLTNDSHLYYSHISVVFSSRTYTHTHTHNINFCYLFFVISFFYPASDIYILKMIRIKTTNKINRYFITKWIGKAPLFIINVQMFLYF